MEQTLEKLVAKKKLIVVPFKASSSENSGIVDGPEPAPCSEQVPLVKLEQNLLSLSFATILSLGFLKLDPSSLATLTKTPILWYITDNSIMYTMFTINSTTNIKLSWNRDHNSIDNVQFNRRPRDYRLAVVVCSGNKSSLVIEKRKMEKKNLKNLCIDDGMIRPNFLVPELAKILNKTKRFLGPAHGSWARNEE